MQKKVTVLITIYSTKTCSLWCSLVGIGIQGAPGRCIFYVTTVSYVVGSVNNPPCTDCFQIHIKFSTGNTS